MSQLILSTAGGAIGGMFGPIGAIEGQLAGAALGGAIDNALFGAGDQTRSGPQLADLDVMASTEGAPIPRVYGRARLSGQVIWATPLEEVGTSEIVPTDGGKASAAGRPPRPRPTATSRISQWGYVRA